MSTIASLTELRRLYAAAGGRALQKQIDRLDPHCRHFIALSPFLVLATGDETWNMDASPRGGEPGFVKVSDAGDVLIPDSPGNNRLDSLENIVRCGQAGLLFMIPGINETLRVNGRAQLSVDPAHIALCSSERRAPKLVIQVQVQAAYLHCAKAFMRSKLWLAEAQQPRDALPTIGQMIADQTGMDIVPESREAMERRYAADL